MIDEERICHNFEITSLMSINNEVLLTYSMQDQMVKIWRLGGEECTCFKEFKLKVKAICFEFDATSNCLAFMDTNCHIGTFQYDF